MERDRLDDLDIDGKIVLNLILQKWDGRSWSEMFRLRIRTGGGML